MEAQPKVIVTHINLNDIGENLLARLKGIQDTLVKQFAEGDTHAMMLMSTIKTHARHNNEITTFGVAGALYCFEHRSFGDVRLDEDDSNFSQAMDDLVRQVYERVYAETKVRSDEIFERMVAKDGLAVKLMASMKECEESASQSDGEGVGVMEALLFFGALYLYETGGAAPKAMTV